MVILEVNLDINTEIYDEFKPWIIEHVKEVLVFKGFIEAKILLEHSEAQDKKKITCSYLLDSQASLDNYLVNHSPTIRQKTSDRFGKLFMLPDGSLM